MVNEKPSPYHGARMDFYSGQPSRNLRDTAWEKWNLPTPEPMRNPMGKEGMKTRVGKKYFQTAGCRWITLKHGP